MEKNFILKDVQITPITKERIEKKIDKLEKLSSQILVSNFLLEKDNSRFIAELKINLKHKTVMAKKESYKMGVAINEVFKKIKREISDYKGKVRKK